MVKFSKTLAHLGSTEPGNMETKQTGTDLAGRFGWQYTRKERNIASKMLSKPSKTESIHQLRICKDKTFLEWNYQKKHIFENIFLYSL